MGYKCLTAWSPSKEDVSIMKDIFAKTGFFYDFELDVVNELIDSFIEDRFNVGYCIQVAGYDHVPAAVMIYSRDTMSRHAWDIYWIATDPQYQGRGLGKWLLHIAEDDVKNNGGGIMYIETCSRPLYEPTRQFYLKCGYTIEGVLKDYYADGDSKCIFSKRIGGYHESKMPAQS